MDSNALLYLVEIVDAGNISAAARRLKMTRANMSYHLNQLERDVGANLLRRTTRSLELTEIGQRLYQQGCIIKNALAIAKEAASQEQAALQGSIRISVPHGYGQFILAPLFLEFKHLHPGINLNIMFDNRIQDLIRDEIDVAIRVLSQPPQNLEARDLGPVRIIACASRQYIEAHGLPQKLADLKKFPIITSSVIGKKLRVAATQSGIRHELLLEPSLASDNFLFLRDAVLDNLGVGLVADYLVKDHILSGEIVQTLQDWELSIFGNRMNLLFMPNKYHARTVATFIEFLVDRAKAPGSQEADLLNNRS